VIVGSLSSTASAREGAGTAGQSSLCLSLTLSKGFLPWMGGWMDAWMDGQGVKSTQIERRKKSIYPGLFPAKKNAAPDLPP
jgi:hypothetical protein